MLAHNFIRKSIMNVDDILQDNVPEKIYSSVLFTLVNLPYRDKSIDIEDIEIDGIMYKCYKNRYDFTNGKMIIIKIASTQFVPFGIYARKIMNFLIAEFTYKKNYPHIYEDNISKRMITLGKKPIDFVEKICGTRKVGSNTRVSILKQLEAILNCYMAIATGYRQVDRRNDELFADKHQFALIEATNANQLINHRFDVTNNWQEEIYVSDDLAKILSQHIMPLDKDVYLKITSPMELDVYQYFTYQNYNSVQRGIDKLQYSWEESMSLFGRGYAKTSQGLSDFRRDFRKIMTSLQSKVNLALSAPLDSKYITFLPSSELLIENKKPMTKSMDELKYEPYKNLFNDSQSVDISSEWQKFINLFNLTNKFDNNAIKTIQSYFNKNADITRKTIKYVLEQATKNPSAFVKKALAGNWAVKYDEFNQRCYKWQNDYDLLNSQERQKLQLLATKACDFLYSRHKPEEFSLKPLVLIYMRFFYHNHDINALLADLDGSKYKKYFKNHHELIE